MHFELIFFFIWCEVGIQLHSLVSGDPVFPAPFTEATFLFPLNGPGTLVENQLP